MIEVPGEEGLNAGFPGARGDHRIVDLPPAHAVVPALAEQSPILWSGERHHVNPAPIRFEQRQRVVPAQTVRGRKPGQPRDRLDESRRREQERPSGAKPPLDLADGRFVMFMPRADGGDQTARVKKRANRNPSRGAPAGRAPPAGPRSPPRPPSP